MNRDIKFRAWDIIDDRMIGWWDKIFLKVKNDSRLCEITLKNIESSFLKYMQYTGLKDKNDKEIYEGDIVEFRMNVYQGTYKGEVVFEKGCFIVNYRIITDGFKEYLYQTSQAEEKFEVIGNIYESNSLPIKKEVKTLDARDKNWLDILRHDRDNRYQVIVNRNSAHVEDNERDLQPVYDFQVCGHELALVLFEYMGIKAKMC